MISFAGIFAGIAFVIGFVACLFWPGQSFLFRVYCASIPAAITFVASILLMVRDRRRNEANHLAIRAVLMAREDLSDEEFGIRFPGEDSKWVVQVRNAIATFYRVPEAKIRPDDDLDSVLGFGTFEPQLLIYVISVVFAENGIAPHPVTIRLDHLHSLSDLAFELKCLIEGLDRDR